MRRSQLLKSEPPGETGGGGSKTVRELTGFTRIIAYLPGVNL